jgi:hypothetical protein
MLHPTIQNAIDFAKQVGIDVYICKDHTDEYFFTACKTVCVGENDRVVGMVKVIKVGKEIYTNLIELEQCVA